MVAHPRGPLLLSAKRKADLLNRKNAAGAPLSLACYPKPCSVARDKKEWDRFTEYARIWSTWKLIRHANRRSRFGAPSRLIVLYD
jgi:hypothetical protein